MHLKKYCNKVQLCYAFSIYFGQMPKITQDSLALIYRDYNILDFFYVMKVKLLNQD